MKINILITTIGIKKLDTFYVYEFESPCHFCTVLNCWTNHMTFTIQKPDNFATGHILTIQKLDLSGIQMVTVPTTAQISKILKKFFLTGSGSTSA